MEGEDSEEVDIGTFRSSSWIPSHPEISRLPPNVSHREVSSPSPPDVAESLHTHHPAIADGLTRGHLRNHSVVSLDPAKVARIQRWILFDFDLDVGPVLDCVYPEIRLSPASRENIAFSSFPDSAVFETGSQAHSFKVTLSGEFPKSDEHSVWLSENGFVYGYACFVQRRDSTSRRGYLQRSTVILSQLMLPSLFEELVTILAPLYLSHGIPMLESACQNVCVWPDPVAGMSLELGFLGSVIQARLPRNTDELQFAEAASRTGVYVPSEMLASLPSSSPLPLAVFGACLPSIWSIWELLILCEPILVFGTSPRITSLAVWWLRDLIRPITVAGDFRPYMTIHDQDYAILINKYPPKAGLVVGVTNPFVLTVTQHWPHVLSLGWEGEKSPSISKINNFALDMPGIGSPGFTSQSHKRFTSKDRPLLKLWEDALKKGDRIGRLSSFSKQSGVLNAIYIEDFSQQLRRHFALRTASFLAPLNRYLNSLIPSPAEASETSTDGKPRLKQFNAVHFLSSLQVHGTPLPFRSSSRKREFYEKWLRTPAFALWLAGQQQIVTDVLENPLRRSS